MEKAGKARAVRCGCTRFVPDSRAFSSVGFVLQGLSRELLGIAFASPCFLSVLAFLYGESFTGDARETAPNPSGDTVCVLTRRFAGDLRVRGRCTQDRDCRPKCRSLFLRKPGIRVSFSENLIERYQFRY